MRVYTVSGTAPSETASTPVTSAAGGVAELQAETTARAAARDREGKSHRTGNAIGPALVARTHAEGYKIGVHTGGPKDHELHTEAEAAAAISPISSCRSGGSEEPQ